MKLATVQNILNNFAFEIWIDRFKRFHLAVLSFYKDTSLNNYDHFILPKQFIRALKIMNKDS